MDCREVHDKLVFYLDEELPLSESDRIRHHVETCEACARRARFEGLFRAALGRIDYHPAPPGLETRIRAALDAEDERASWWARGWLDVVLSRTVLAVATALLLVAVVWLADKNMDLQHQVDAIQNRAVAGAPQPPGDRGVLPVGGRLERIQGTVVCAECDAHDAPIEAQRRCRTYGHSAGLRADSGELYHFLKTGEEPVEVRDLIYSPDRRGAHVEVEGRLFPDIGYIAVARVSNI